MSKALSLRNPPKEELHLYVDWDLVRQEDVCGEKYTKIVIEFFDGDGFSYVTRYLL